MDAAVPFLDTNVLVRLIARDHEAHFLSASELFQRIERGETRVAIADTVIFETAFVLQQIYGLDRRTIRDALLPIIQNDFVALATKDRYVDVFELYVTRRGLSFADCYHAILARELRAGVIISFDRGFERIPGLTRREPSLPA